MRVSADRMSGLRAKRGRTASILRQSSWAGWLSVPMALWTLDWAAINTGPWNLRSNDGSFVGLTTAVRAALPLVLCAITIFGVLRGLSSRRSWVEKGFWIYGIVMTLACTGADEWFGQAYWGFAFLGALGVCQLVVSRPNRLAALERLNWLSWMITTAVLVGLLFLARDVLMAPGADASAYGLINRYQDVHGYGMARETGLSRMAAIPSIISLVFFVSASGWRKWASVPVFLASAYIIWIMQSRGALFAFAGAFLFVIPFGHKKGRGMVWVAAFVVGSALLLLTASQEQLNALWGHITRNEGIDGIESASGRFDIYADLLGHWMDSPILGYGPQADRLFNWNAQNALVYALLCSGIVGATFFVIAMISAWCALVNLAMRAAHLPERQRMMFQITGALFVYATLRSIPENNAALFSVDLLLQYPAMLYLVALDFWSRGSVVRI